MTQYSDHIEWTEIGQPKSLQFGDVYYGPNGVEECQHVFINGSGLNDRLNLCPSGQITIGETGFGTGLNFLCAWDEWDRAGRPGSIHFISVEKYPLSELDLTRAHAPFTDLADKSAALREQWGDIASGVQGKFEAAFESGHIKLTVIVGDAKDALASIGPDHIVDFWFLDGFAPADNPDLWNDRIFAQLARLSKDGAGLSTFTAVGDVRRGLAAHGFAVERIKGFGRKRHMTNGRFDAALAPPPVPHKLSWAGRSASHSKINQVTIVGAGLCGLSLAYHLNSLAPDLPVKIVEQAQDWSTSTSALPAALVSPWLDKGNGPNARVMDRAYTYSCQFWRVLGTAHPDVWHETGLDIFPENATDQTQFRHLAKVRPGYEWLDDHLHIRGTGWVNGAAALNAMAQYTNVEFGADNLGQEALSPPPTGHAIVYCTGKDLDRVFPDANWPLKRLAGQTVSVRNVGGEIQSVPQKRGHYRIPIDQGMLLIGATFEEGGTGAPTAAGRATLLDGIGAVEKSEVVSDWGGVRAALPDRMPLMGAIPDFTQWEDLFKPIRHGPLAIAGRVGSYKSGTYVLGGVGSRGFMSAPFLAKQLAQMILNQSGDLDRDEIAALHPGRFLVRALKGG